MKRKSGKLMTSPNVGTPSGRLPDMKNCQTPSDKSSPIVQKASGQLKSTAHIEGVQ